MLATDDCGTSVTCFIAAELNENFANSCQILWEVVFDTWLSPTSVFLNRSHSVRKVVKSFVFSSEDFRVGYDEKPIGSSNECFYLLET